MGNPDGTIQTQIRELVSIVEVLEGVRPIASLIPPPESLLYLPGGPEAEKRTGNYIICGRSIAWCSSVLRGDVRMAERAFPALIEAIGGQRRGWMSIEGRYCEQNSCTPHGEYWLAGVAVTRAVADRTVDQFKPIVYEQAARVIAETGWWLQSFTSICDICSVRGKVFLPGLNCRIKEPKPGIWTGFQMAYDIIRRYRRVLRPNQREDPLFVGVRAMEWLTARGDRLDSFASNKSLPYMIHPMTVSRLSSSHLLATIDRGKGEKVMEKWVLDSVEVKNVEGREGGLVFRGSKGWKNPIQHPEGAARVVTPREI